MGSIKDLCSGEENRKENFSSQSVDRNWQIRETRPKMKYYFFSASSLALRPTHHCHPPTDPVSPSLTECPLNFPLSFPGFPWKAAPVHPDSWDCPRLPFFSLWCRMKSESVSDLEKRKTGETLLRRRLVPPVSNSRSSHARMVHSGTWAQRYQVEPSGGYHNANNRVLYQYFLQPNAFLTELLLASCVKLFPCRK